MMHIRAFASLPLRFDLLFPTLSQHVCFISYINHYTVKQHEPNARTSGLFPPSSAPSSSPSAG